MSEREIKQKKKKHISEKTIFEQLQIGISRMHHTFY